MAILITLQLLVPLAMLLWLALVPPASRVTLALQLAATAAWLVAIALMGLWTLLPWWLPYALGVVLAALAVSKLRAWHSRPMLPAGLPAWLNAGLWAALSAFSLVQIDAARSGRTMPAGRFADIATPFREGTFLVVNGGNDPGINAHLRTLSTDEPRFRAWRGQSHGVDLVRIDELGLRATGMRPADPGAYLGFGTAVVAPCAGTVVQTRDGLPDNTVPETDRDYLPGNHVIIRCDGFDLILAHLRNGSVTVLPAEEVRTGQQVGELGNSGNSDEPHLHVHAQYSLPATEPFAGEPLPLRIDGRYQVRNNRLSASQESD